MTQWSHIRKQSGETWRDHTGKQPEKNRRVITKTKPKVLVLISECKENQISQQTAKTEKFAKKVTDETILVPSNKDTFMTELFPKSNDKEDLEISQDVWHQRNSSADWCRLRVEQSVIVHKCAEQDSVGIVQASRRSGRFSGRLRFVHTDS